MSEWLTTGQMIDKLKVGEIAESKSLQVIKGECGTIYIHNEHGKTNYVLTIFDHVTNEKWRIRPNYVSFEEAIKAYKEGKEIVFHKNGKTYHFLKNGCNFFLALGKDCVSLIEMLSDYWTIED